MSETFQNKYSLLFEANCNCVVINDPHYHAPVTINAGQAKNLPVSSEKIKEAIETCDKEGLLASGTSWWAIYRVLTEKCGYPKNKRDFQSVIENLGIEVGTKIVYDNWRNVNIPRLNVSVDTWMSLSDKLNSTEMKMYKLAERLMEML